MKLDKYQEEAINNNDDKVLLIAPPGSGKTTVLNEKISRLILNGMDPKRMVILTFSKGAALNMKERFQKKFQVSPFFATMHSYCYRMIVKYKMKGKSEIKIIDTKGAMKALESLRLKYDIKMEDMQRYIALISKYHNNAQEVINEVSKSFIEELVEEYNSYKKENNLRDFDDLEKEFLNLIEEGEVLNEIEQSTDYFMVDEFQDLNEVQLEILRKISLNAKLFCVGDEDQCIYAFRGSSTRSMTYFDEYFKDGKKLFLKYNYRSSLTINSLANSIIKQNNLRNNKEILSFSEEKSDIRYSEVLDETEQLDLVISRIKEILLNDERSDVAILFRTNEENKKIASRLFLENINFSFISKNFNPYERSTIRDIITFFEVCYLDDINSVSSFSKILKKINHKVTKNARNILNTEVQKAYEKFNEDVNITKVVNQSVKQSVNQDVKRSTKLYFRETCEKYYWKLKEKIRTSFNEKNSGSSDVKRIMNTIKDKTDVLEYRELERVFLEIKKCKRMKINSAVDYFLYVLGYYEYLERSLMDRKAFLSIKKEMEEIIDEIESFGDFKSFYSYLIGYEKFLSKNTTDERVLLGTLHSVKGMEFDNVIIVNVFDGSIPHEKSLQDIEAERRLFYVGVTRSRKNLLVIYPKEYNGVKQRESRLVKNTNLII